MQQFVENFSKVKRISKEWDDKFRKRQQEEMRQVEGQIKYIYENNDEGVFMVDELGVLKEL